MAARALLAEGRIERALVVDLDVHQGDGTAAIFAGDPRVFTFSMHCRTNFPLHKQTSDLDLALDPGLEDDAYLALLGRAPARPARGRRARTSCSTTPASIRMSTTGSAASR